MKIFNKDLRLQDITIMYFTSLAALMVILVASYQSPSTAIDVSSLKQSPSSLLPPLPMPFRMPLDPRGNLQLAWNISYASQEVYMQLRVAELRHGVFLGMSDRGELTNADLVVLWDNGPRSYFGVSIYLMLVYSLCFEWIWNFSGIFWRGGEGQPFLFLPMVIGVWDWHFCSSSLGDSFARWS